MSVIRSKRNESDMQFLHTAMELHVFTIKKCKKLFPKAYTFSIANHMVDSAAHIHRYVVKANSIYPLNQREVQIRRNHFLEAYTELQWMISQMEVAYELLHFDTQDMNEWTEIVNKEMKLISGTMKKDRERYKNLS